LSSLSLPLQQPTQHSATAQRLLQAAALYVLRSRWLVPADKQEEGLRLQQAAQLLRRWSIGSGLAGYRIVANMLEGVSVYFQCSSQQPIVLHLHAVA
jgi:hypothetical protein